MSRYPIPLPIISTSPWGSLLTEVVRSANNWQDHKTQRAAIQQGHEQKMQGAAQANRWLDHQAQLRHEELVAQGYVCEKRFAVVDKVLQQHEKTGKALRKALRKQRPEDMMLLLQALNVHGDQLLRFTESLPSVQMQTSLYPEPDFLSCDDED